MTLRYCQKHEVRIPFSDTPCPYCQIAELEAISARKSEAVIQHMQEIQRLRELHTQTMKLIRGSELYAHADKIEAALEQEMGDA